jgi:hypothetical protein
MRSHLLAPALLLAITGSACAQCTWFIDDVPDFDQRRSASGGIDGLPGNGGMYCVPTSFTNWFAYLANRGLPQPLTLAGPRNWEDNANYDRVTDALDFLGTLMETHPTEGTKGKAVSGAKLYNTFACGGDLVISGDHIWGDGGTPTPASLLAYQKIGAYTAGTYGFYTSATGGTRTGGHAITFNGVWDLGCGSAPILQFRDPADDSANTTQSDFRTCLAALVPVTGSFRPNSDASFRTVTMYRMDITSASTNFLDAIYVIMPLSAIFDGGGTDAGELQLVRPWRPAGNPAPESLPFNKPAGTGAVLDVVATPDPLVHYYITAGGASQAATIWRLNILTGNSTRVINPGVTGFAPKRLAYGRLGDLYVIDGESVRRYDSRTTPLDPIGGMTPTFTPRAIAYDDKNDTVAILTDGGLAGSRRLLAYPRSLSGFGTDRPIPNTYNGEVYVQPDADEAGAYFVCSDGSGVLRRYIGSGSEYLVTDTITHINGSLSALNVTDANRLIYANNGVLVEREENSSGVWVNRANSRWAGRQAEGAVSIARSRTNFLAPVMNHPSFNNLSNPTIYPGLPTCYPNCDQSTLNPVLNVQDFACFLNKFASGDVYANCDNSTTVPYLNVQDFACFLNKFAAGCT